MEYHSFDKVLNKEALLDIIQTPHYLKEYYKVLEGYIRKDDAKRVILETRQKFKEIVMKHKGPSIIPTIFKNHADRYEYVRERDRDLHQFRNVQKPPQLPFFVFTFADDIFLNLACNFRDNEFRAYINHGPKARFVFLNKKSCGEMAFKDLISNRAEWLYSKSKQLSQYIEFPISTDTEISNLTNCSNLYQYKVDFSVILPEMKISTVWVYCTECGALLETVLCDKTIKVIREEILHNITQTKINKVDENTDSVYSVIPLYTRSSYLPAVCFVEGVMGVTPLTKGNPLKPSIFVRIQLNYICHKSFTNIREVVHQVQDQGVTDPEIISVVSEVLD